MTKFQTLGRGLLVVSFLVLAACAQSTTTGNSTPSGTTTSAAATMPLGSGRFSGTTSVSIQAGQAVAFDDTNGGPHNLVTGMGGTPSAESGAPQALGAPGLAFNGGEVHTVIFPTAGTYHITCTIHPSMQATVTVS